MSASNPPTVVVTGDHDFDFNIYLPTDAENPPPGTPDTIIRPVLGEAGTVQRVLSQVSASSDRPFRVRVAVDHEAEHGRVSALWMPAEIGPVGKNPSTKIWRMKRSLSLGRRKENLDLPQPEISR